MAHRKHPHAPGTRNVLGPGIRWAREERGWSQDELARRLQLARWDVDRTLIARIELRTRCITDTELLILAKVLGVTLDRIAVEAGAPSTKPR